MIAGPPKAVIQTNNIGNSPDIPGLTLENWLK